MKYAELKQEYQTLWDGCVPAAAKAARIRTAAAIVSGS